MATTVRTFRAPDSMAALAAAKAELGPEAVVCSTREIRGGLLRRSEFEVTAAIVEPVDNRPAPAPKPASQAAVVPLNPWADELRELREAVNEAKKALLAVANEARTGEELQLPPAAARAVARLVARGVEDVLAEGLLRQALAEGAPPSESTLHEAIAALLTRRLRVGPPPWLPPEKGGRRILALVGPTGVGKTTSLAKIAAKAVLEAKQKVALITVDCYRIGARDQIGEYGKIMKVPTFEASNARELAKALAGCSKADLILVDTGGRSNAEEVQRQAEMLRTVAGIELSLVFSAAVGPLQAAAIANSYRALLPESLIATKLDEAVAPGALLSVGTRIRQPLVAVGDGQRIPEDIHAATGEALAKLLLGEASARVERSQTGT